MVHHTPELSAAITNLVEDRKLGWLEVASELNKKGFRTGKGSRFKAPNAARVYASVAAVKAHSKGRGREAQRGVAATEGRRRLKLNVGRQSTASSGDDMVASRIRAALDELIGEGVKVTSISMHDGSIKVAYERELELKA